MRGIERKREDKERRERREKREDCFVSTTSVVIWWSFSFLLLKFKLHGSGILSSAEQSRNSSLVLDVVRVRGIFNGFSLTIN